MSEPAATHELFTPIVKIFTVKAPPESAFRRFTEEMGTWWPLASHSVGGANAETVAMEPRVGGRIIERIRGGRECTWGTISAWEPPRRVAFTWHPGMEPETAQDIEVQFTAAAADRTQVELTHTGFERLGAMARRARRGYPMGWSYVLGLYAERRDLGMKLVTGLTALMMAIMRWREERKAKTQEVRQP